MAALLLALLLASQTVGDGPSAEAGAAAPNAASADTPAAELQAPAAPAAAVPGVTVTGRPCVVVDIAGTRTGVLDCANRDLDAAARLARTRARIGRVEAPQDVRSNPAALGLSNVAATRNRMGSEFGRGVRPQPQPMTTPSGGIPPRR